MQSETVQRDEATRDYLVRVPHHLTPETEAAFRAGWDAHRSRKRPKVLLSMPCTQFVMVPFFQSVLGTMLDPDIEIVPYIPNSTVIHLARDDSLKYVRNDPSFTHLCFVDSDQLFDPLILRRLLSWQVPVVAPVVIQGIGDPIPVCYQEIGQTPDGFYRYQEQGAAVCAYLSQFREHWWTRAPSTVLPLNPEFPPDMAGIPQDILKGITNPLYEVQAVGTGMVLFEREPIDAMVPDEKSGLLCSFNQGGEDFEIMRRIRDAGYSIYVDRGALIGHVRFWSRGIGDLWEWQKELNEQAAEQEAKDAALPPVSELVDELRREQERPVWRNTKLPGELARVSSGEREEVAA